MGKFALSTALCVILAGMGAVAAHAGEEPPTETVETEVVSDILDDTAAGIVEGDTVVTEVGNVEITVPSDAVEPISVESDNGRIISITLPDSTSDSTSVVDAETSSVVHENTDGTAVIPLVREDGTLQILSVIQEESAPTRFSYDFGSDGGVQLRLTPSGGAEVVDAAGIVIADVAVPWALDAAGTSIPTHFEVSGARLDQVVDAGAISAPVYPIVADPAVTVTTYEYKYVNVNRIYNWTNKARQLGICKVQAGAGGGTCSISNSYSVQTTVSVTFGLTKGVVAAGIGIEASKTVTGNITWKSGKAPVGSTFKAWAVGTKVTYQVQKWKVSKAGGRTTRTLMSTSGTLTAFSPVAGFAVGR